VVSREQGDPDEQELRERVDEQDAAQQHPLQPVLDTKLHHGHQLATHGPATVGRGVLHGVAHLVRSHGGEAALRAWYTGSLRFTVRLAGL
jgi:hypothetical protein